MRRVTSILLAGGLALLTAISGVAEDFFPSVETLQAVTKDNQWLVVTGALKENEQAAFYDTGITIHDEEPIMRAEADHPYLIALFQSKQTDKAPQMSLWVTTNPQAENTRFDSAVYSKVADEFFVALFPKDQENQVKMRTHLDSVMAEGQSSLSFTMDQAKDQNVCKFESGGKRYGFSAVAVGGAIQLLILTVGSYDDQTVMDAHDPSITEDSAAYVQPPLTIKKASIKKGKFTVEVTNPSKEQTIDAFDVMLLEKDEAGHFMRTNSMGAYETVITVDETVKPGKSKTKKSIALDATATGAQTFVALSRAHVKGGDTIVIPPEQYVWIELP